MNAIEAEFRAEIDAWLFGIQNYPGEISRTVLHRIIRELSGTFQKAIEHRVDINIHQLANDFCSAAKFLVHENEFATAIVAQLPRPNSLQDAEQQFVTKMLTEANQNLAGLSQSLLAQWSNDELDEISDCEDPFQ